MLPLRTNLLIVLSELCSDEYNFFLDMMSYSLQKFADVSEEL
jgi:hypothetical protein